MSLVVGWQQGWLAKVVGWQQGCLAKVEASWALGYWWVSSRQRGC